MWSSLTKDHSRSLDLGLFTGTRRALRGLYGSVIGECTYAPYTENGRLPPLPVFEFAQVMQKKSFTNGKEDSELVTTLYKDAFTEQFQKATRLRYPSLGWGDSECCQLVRTIGTQTMFHLELLDLSHNKIGNVGGEAIAKLLRQGLGLVRLRRCSIAHNMLGDQAAHAFAKVDDTASAGLGV